MFRLVHASPALRHAAAQHRARLVPRRARSTPAAPQAAAPKAASPLAGDSGDKATHLHHHMTTFLAVATPIYLFSPAAATDGLIDKGFGVVLAAAIAGHSWIGLNYVATDYVPKISNEKAAQTILTPCAAYPFMHDMEIGRASCIN